MLFNSLCKVFPITSYPIAEINQNSIRIVNQHKGAFPNERLLKQVSQKENLWAHVKVNFIIMCSDIVAVFVQNWIKLNYRDYSCQKIALKHIYTKKPLI